MDPEEPLEIQSKKYLQKSNLNDITRQWD